jgi:hypothetical protein
VSEQRVTGFDVSTPTKIGDWYDWPFSSNIVSEAYTTSAHDVGYKISSGHPYISALKSHTGGYFFLDKQGYTRTPGASATVIPRGPPGTPTYKGSVVVNPPGSPSLADASVWNDPDFYFNEAWNRARPAKPDWSALNAIYELKDIPQTLKSGFKAVFEGIGNTPKKQLRGAGEFHVALQFGWLPLWRDVKQFVWLQRNGQKRVDQLIRDNGKSVRRSGVLKTNSQTAEVSQLGNSDFDPVFVIQAYNGQATGSVVHTIRDEIRYSGRFKYWLPPGPQDVEWRRKILSRIYGERLTPSTVYNAIPWSWLADWFSNLGSFIDAISPGVEDRLATDYFYVTRYTEGRGTATGAVPLETDLGVQFLGAQSTSYVKRIIRADGPSFAPELIGIPSLSGMQESILAGIAAQKYRR